MSTAVEIKVEYQEGKLAEDSHHSIFSRDILVSSSIKQVLGIGNVSYVFVKVYIPLNPI